MTSTVFQGKCSIVTIPRIFCCIAMILLLEILLMLPDINKDNCIHEIMYDSSIPVVDVDIVYTWGGVDASVDELKYSMRSVFQNAPWFRYIFIVFNDDQEKPNWFNDSNHRVKWIKLSEIFSVKDNAMDNHNSQAIEININNIKELSEYYVYLNDDWFFGREMPIEYLFDFTQNKTKFSKYYYEHYQFRMMFQRSDEIYHCPTSFHKGLKTPKHGIINFEIEHIPRAFIKSKLQMFLNEYKAWALYVESHKERYSSCGPHDHEESIYRTYLKELFDEDQIMVFDEGITKTKITQMLDCFNSDVAQWFLPFVPNDESLLRRLVCYDNPYHLWMRSDHESTLVSTEYYMDWIKREKPYTFCIQDNWNNQHMENYDQKVDTAMKFYEKMFPHTAEWELLIV